MTTTSNAERARQYLAAVASLESAERVSEFFASDGVFQEFPNRIAPTGVFAMRPTCERPSSEVARSSNRRATVSRTSWRQATKWQSRWCGPACSPHQF